MLKTILNKPSIGTALAVAGVVTYLTSAAVASTNGPSVRLTSRGNELARTTGLRHGDLPATFHGGFVTGRPGDPACRAARPPDDKLHVSGYATAAFSHRTARVASKVTVYGTTAMTDVLFGRLASSYSAACAAFAAGASGRVISASALRVDVGLDHARGFSVVLRRNGVYWAGRVYFLGEGRIASTLLVEQRGRQFPEATAALTLSLLESRMED